MCDGSHMVPRQNVRVSRTAACSVGRICARVHYRWSATIGIVAIGVDRLRTIVRSAAALCFEGAILISRLGFVRVSLV